MRHRTFIALLAFLIATAVQAQPVRRRALLVGINDYSASKLPAPAKGGPCGRSVPNLDGAINDVEIMRDLLVTLYGFKPADVVTLTDQQATREAILVNLRRHLLAPARKDDVVFFYYSGHGSQVRNSLSSEADHLDESLVPADSQRGARDIRDKELLGVFNGILTRGAQLTVVLDACHSGSGARGLDGGLRYRAVEPDLCDVADGDAADRATAQRPERRGALILSAAQDFDLAFEIRDEQRRIRGAFTWALARALRDADPGEPASDTFLRAQARLHAEWPAQDPVLAGTAAVRARPFLGVRSDRRDRRPVIAVEKENGPGTYLLQGGWANGLTIGSELRLAGRDTRLEVTSFVGLSRCLARLTSGTRPLPGALLEIVTWAAPPSPPLRVWMPRAPRDLLALARALRAEAARRGIRWLDDPTERTPTHLLRWRDGAWELVADGRGSRPPATALLAGVPARASLFVQFPAPTPLVDAIGAIDGLLATPGPDTADYLLAGHLGRNRLEYAWIRPAVTVRDRARSVLPLRTAWTAANDALTLRESAVRLRRVQGWHDLRSPAPSSYRIAVRHAGGALVENGTLVGRSPYQLVLRARPQTSAAPLFSRYLYAFTINSDGSSSLLFPPPESGAVENLLPSTPTPGQPLRNPPTEIVLTGMQPLRIVRPYGIDTFFLLSTDEPLPNLAGFEWKGVRSDKNLLADLFAQTFAGTRSPTASTPTPPTWSIDRVVFESVPPKKNAR